MSSDANLGSLSQSARSKELKTARGILLFIGVLTVAVNGFFFSQIEKQIEEQFNNELAELHRQGMVVDDAEVQQLKQSAILIAQAILGGAVALGVVFIVFGIMVNKFPVPITVTSLVLYIGATAIFGLIDPTTLLRGIIIKIIIVVALFKSVQAALAYQKEANRSDTAGGMPSFAQEP